MNLRPVTMDHAQMLLEWRNDPETRANSRNRDMAKLAGHLTWLEQSLINPDRDLYIAEVDGTPVGTVRVDIDKSDGHAEFSWTIAPEARGKGYGKQMVVQCAREMYGDEKWKAEIKKGNTASEKIAQALGLSPTDERPSEDPDDLRPLVVWKDTR